MSRLIFSWELGTSYGYISQLLPFARALKKRGHDVAISVRELHHMYRVIENHGIPVFQSPIWLPNVHGFPEPPLNYAEMMLRFGYHDAPALAGVVSAWRALLIMYRADMLIACHAPTALLAAKTLGIKAATLGTGFYVPPCSPTPNMRPWLTVPQERLENADRIVLNTLNTILSSCEKPIIYSLSEWFETEESFLCTFPEIDQYPMRQDAKYWGAAYDVDMGKKVAWPSGNVRRILVYMGAHHRDFEPIVKAIKTLGLTALIFALGISDNMRRQLTDEKVIISAAPIHFDSVLTECDLAICHAGHGTVSRLLLAGVPMLLFAAHLEQYLLAIRVKEMGAGEIVNQEKPSPDFVALLQDMLDSPAYSRQAKNFSKRYADFAQINQVANICDRIEDIAA